MNIINKMTIANVSTKVNTGSGIAVINSRSKNNTNISNSVNDMMIDNIIDNINTILINVLV